MAIEWYVAKAREMYAAGMTTYGIAKILHVGVDKINYAVDPDKYRAQARERNQRRQETLKKERPTHYFDGVRTHVPRQIKQILNPAVRDEAVRLFAIGKIDRAELSRRLHNGATP